MKNVFAICTVMISALTVSSTFATEAPKVPASAKKLTGAEITLLYDNATIAFDNFTQKSSVTGTATFDLKKKTSKGTWESGGQSGNFTGAVQVKGDKWCYVNGNKKQVCDSVYMDGDDIYEVNAKGIVDSKNRKK